MRSTTLLSAPRLRNFIAGEFSAPLAGEHLPNVDPFSSEVLNEVPASREEDVRAAVSAASLALPAWGKTPVRERAECLRRIADEIEKRSEEFALAESRDTGKPLALSTNVDIDRGVHNFRFFADVLMAKEQKSFEQMMPQHARHHIAYRPVGVAALISPWNLPLYLLSWKVSSC